MRTESDTNAAHFVMKGLNEERNMTIKELEQEIVIPEEYLSDIEKYPNLVILFNLAKKGNLESALGFYRCCIKAGTLTYTREELTKTRSKRNNARLKSTYGSWWIGGGKDLILNSLLRERGFKCEICKDTFSRENLTIDHIIPISIGGDRIEKSNLQLACRKCHTDKESEHQHRMGTLSNFALDKRKEPTVAGSISNS